MITVVARVVAILEGAEVVAVSDVVWVWAISRRKGCLLGLLRCVGFWGGVVDVDFFFFQAEDGIRDTSVTGVQTCALPISYGSPCAPRRPRLAGADAVHMDFHPGNLLASGGAITGVVDWDGAARGDRRFDLVTLRFGIHAQETDPGVTQRLDAVLDSLPEDILRPTWAHMSLRMVDWAI